MSTLHAAPTDASRTKGDDTSSARGSSVGSVLVTTAGIIGSVALLAGWVFGLSVLVFATGSMAPAMPTGTAAIVQTVAAADIRPGDVVTVPKEGSPLPVTHRVVSTSTVDGDPAARSLVLRGDANAAEDRDPAVVREAKRVLVAIPGAGYAVVALQSPLAIAIIATIVLLGVVWAFWPRETSDDLEQPEPVASDA